MKDVKYLINAAGVFSPKAFLDHTGEDHDAYMDLNRATFFVTQRVAKNMVVNLGGSVVNVGSMWAIRQFRRHLRRRIPWLRPGCIP